MKRILHITERKPECSSSRSKSRSLQLSLQRRQESRISEENSRLLRRLEEQQSGYRMNNPEYRGHRRQVLKISKFSEYNQARLQSIIRSLKVSPREASYLPGLRSDRKGGSVQGAVRN
jgi:hypothetical protein